MQIPLTKQAYLVNGERAINLYPVWNASEKFYEFLGTEGLELFSAVSGYPVRGLHVMSNDSTKLWAVVGSTFYQVLTSGTAISKGTLNSSQGLVEISDNGLQITITDGEDGYTYTISTQTFAEITDADFPGGGSNTVMNGYTIVAKPNDEQVNSSDLNDSTAWDPLNFANAEGIPDDLMRVVEYNQKLYLLGVVSTEVWFYDGGSGFPFTRFDGAVMGFGLAAKNSLAKNDQALYFLARTTAPDGERVIVEVRQLTATIVSTQGINELLATLTSPASAEGFAYMREGHSMYEITFPADDITLVYDAKEQLWHERKSTDSNGDQIRHRARCYAYFSGYHMVGDYNTGNIYKLKADVYTENGTTIKRKLIVPELTDASNNRKFDIPELIVPMKTGVGLETGQGSDPLLMMRYSKDGGNTWSNEKIASFGKIGEYDTRVRFRRCGEARRFMPELSTSDPVEIKFEGPLMVVGE